MKVVFHIDEMNKWHEAHRNVINLLEEAQNTRIVVAVNGEAIMGFMEDSNQPFLAMPEILFHACSHALVS